MDCLWITLADPDPAINGQFIYSKGLIEATRLAGVKLCVIGLARSGETAPRRDEVDLVWRLTARQHWSRVERLFSGKPELALSGYSMASLRLVEESLAERDWEVVVVDSLCAGWAIDAVLRHRANVLRPPALVYVAHNHELTVARRMVDANRGLRRLVKQIDALKVRHLERRLVAAADLVTSNTPEDARTFVAGANGTPVAFLPPGYSGPRVVQRVIGADTPRRIVMVGSFDWPPKRVSLERFLATGAPRLVRAGIDLQIVGAAEIDYLAAMRERYPFATFVGPVDDVRPYMAGARLALVPDMLGGFKLKGLDYVFNRLPILALRIALPGMPLDDGRSIGLFDSHEAMAEGAVALIDDFAELNRRQTLAYDACAARFDWRRVGAHLVGHVHRAVHRPPPTAAAPTGGTIRATAGG